jgi:hypothetical protein
MTNPATEARWEYYRKAYPGTVRGTPTAVFNGKAEPSSGGGVAGASTLYQQYREIIDPLLDAQPGPRIQAKAVRDGDTIAIQVELSRVKEPGPELKLRLFLVEEQIRFGGGNGIRFHHQVVRAMPGGPEGMPVLEATSKHTATVNLSTLRRELSSYLDRYAAEQRPFPNMDRPLGLEHLRLIALVQDDQSHEILQAQQLDIGEK